MSIEMQRVAPEQTSKADVQRDESVSESIRRREVELELAEREMRLRLRKLEIAERELKLTQAQAQTASPSNQPACNTYKRVEDDVTRRCRDLPRADLPRFSGDPTEYASLFTGLGRWWRQQ